MSGITQALLASYSGTLALEYVGGFATTVAGSIAPSISLSALTGGVATAPQAGDLVIAAVGFGDSNDKNITCTTSGYTEIADLRHSGSSQLGVYYKRLTSAETSVAFNTGVSTNSALAVHVWRNSNSVSPLDATTTTNASGSNSRPDAPSITTATDNAVVLAIGCGVGTSISALTVPSGMVNLAQAFYNGSPDVVTGIASISVSPAGAYNPGAFGGSGSGDSCAATVAIRPS